MLSFGPAARDPFRAHFPPSKVDAVGNPISRLSL
jgi:hypothetical protein